MLLYRIVAIFVIATFSMHIVAGVHRNTYIDEDGDRQTDLPQHDDIPPADFARSEVRAQQLRAKAATFRVKACVKAATMCVGGIVGAVCSWKNAHEAVRRGDRSAACKHAMIGATSLGVGFGVVPNVCTADVKRTKMLEVQALAAERGAHVA